MIRAVAQGWETLPGGKTKVVAPWNLEMGWMMRRWGVSILGPHPNFFQVVRASRALDIFDAFHVDFQQRTPAQIKVVTSVLAEIEHWET